MKNYLIFILSLLLISGLAAQEKPFEEQQAEFEEMFQKHSKSFQERNQQNASAYRAFKQKLDQAFGNYLAKNWASVNPSATPQRDQQPKPLSTPQAQKQPRNPVSIPTVPQDKPQLPQPRLPETPEVLRVPVPVSTNPNVQTFSLEFLRNQFRFPSVDNFSAPVPVPLNHRVIAQYWQTISQKNYLPLLQDLLKKREDLQLNDWAYYQLIRSLADQYSRGNSNESVLFTWFMMLQSGYRVKVGYAPNQVYLLLPSESIIYKNTYYKLRGGYYYVMDAPRTQLTLQIYEKDYPSATQPVKLDVDKHFNTVPQKAFRELNFKHQGQDYNLVIAYDAALIDLYENYPLTDLEIFFDARPASLTAKSLKQEISPYLQGKSDLQAVNFLLALVQHGLAYQTDQEQFGREKTLFIEETLHYPYADCEDRSVLFAYLVKELLGLKVIALDYPGHITTGVRFRDDYPGDHCIYKGEKYLICDPTYIGASAGEAMSTYRSQSPKAIDIHGH